MTCSMLRATLAAIPSLTLHSSLAPLNSHLIAPSAFTYSQHHPIFPLSSKLPPHGNHLEDCSNMTHCDPVPKLGDLLPGIPPTRSCVPLTAS